jgi:hypothetical protein
MEPLHLHLSQHRLKTIKMDKEITSVWCKTCNKHYTLCDCDPKQNIYIVEYRLLVDTPSNIIFCDESVRCVANDIFHAMSVVTAWVELTPSVWCHEDGDEYTVPDGNRHVTIRSVTLSISNVGELLRVQPLPAIFQNE